MVWWTVRTDSKMIDSPPPPQRGHRWLSGLAVTLTTIVAYLAFWRLAPVPTFVIGCAALVGMLVSAWVFGRKANGPLEK